MSNDTIAITVAAFLFLVWAVLYFWTFRTATSRQPTRSTARFRAIWQEGDSDRTFLFTTFRVYLRRFNCRLRYARLASIAPVA